MVRHASEKVGEMTKDERGTGVLMAIGIKLKVGMLEAVALKEAKRLCVSSRSW